MKTAIITREKQYKTPYSNSAFAWRFLYTVNYGEVLPQVGQQTATFDTLASARNACKRNGFERKEAF